MIDFKVDKNIEVGASALLNHAVQCEAGSAAVADQATEPRGGEAISQLAFHPGYFPVEVFEVRQRDV